MEETIQKNFFERRRFLQRSSGAILTGLAGFGVVKRLKLFRRRQGDDRTQPPLLPKIHPDAVARSQKMK